MAALASHAKATAFLARRGRRYTNPRTLGFGTVGGSRPSVDAWLTPPAGGGNATVTPAAITAAVSVPTPTAGQPGNPAAQVVSFGTGNLNGTQDTTLPVSRPAGVAIGDLLLALILTDHATTTVVFDTPAGWTQYGQFGSDVPDAYIGVYWKEADSGDTSGGTVSFTTNESADMLGWILRITDADTTAPIEADNLTAGNATAAVTLLSLTPASDGAAVIGVWSFDGGDGYPFTISGTNWPSSIPTNQELQTSVDATEVSGGWVHQEQATAAASNDLTVTCALSPGTDGWTYGQIVIKAAAASGSATVTPAAVAAVVTVPTPSESVGAAPAAPAAVAAMPAPTAQGGATRTPATVAGAATVPAPAVSVGAAPTQVAATVTVPTPTALTGALTAPAAISAPISVGAPAVSVGAAPAAVAGVATVPTPTAGQTGGGGATPTPTAVASTTTVPRPDVGVGAAAAAVAITATVPAPTALTGATRAPATVTATVAVPGPSVAVGAAPAAVAAVVAMPAPTVFVGAGSAPGSVAAVATVPKPNVSVGTAPARVIATTTVPTPTVVLGFTVGPAAVVVVATTPKPNVGVGVAPAAVVVLVGIGTPTIPGGATGTWSWYLRRSSGWQQSSPLLDGTHATTTDVT